MKNAKVKKISILAIAAIMCGLIGYASLPVSAEKDALYRVNENGKTYGPGIYAHSDDEFPDLILAEGTNQKIGYVKKTDLFEEMPATPEEALERQKNNKARSIPLYEKDGITVIGEFIAGGGFEDLEAEKVMRDKIAESNSSADPTAADN